MRAAVLALLLAAGAFACRGAREGGDAIVPLTLVSVEYGRFLEDLPALEAGGAGPRRALRPETSEGYDARYRRVFVQPERGGTPIQATLHAGPVTDGARFRFACPIAAGARLRWWLFTGAGSNGPASLELAGAGRRQRLPVPQEPERLFLYEIPLPGAPCADGERVSVELRSDAGELAVGPPVVLHAGGAAEPPPPVILVSLDTLRADHWEAGPARPASLSAFLGDALRFEQAYSSFPSTPQSHSVMFSGLFYAEAVRRPVDDDLSLAARLRRAGYLTLGFVSGGYVRAPFGFGERLPGFALGFDLYLEGLQPVDEAKAALARRHETALASEAALPTHTLGPSLERSLRWFAQHPGDPSFHFVHGFDVHEYRSVARRFWDAAVADRSAAGLNPQALELCLLKAGAQMDEDLVVHHRFEAFEAVREQPQGSLEHCHRRIASLMYEARVRSVEEMLGRYLDGLRQLGVYERALIVVTSDHGESLLDEKRPGDEAPAWGHNRILANNLHVPLWIKPPASRGEGRRVRRVVGLVDLRATLADLLGLDLGRGLGASAAAEHPRRPQPLLFQTIGTRDWGLVLDNGDLCVWVPERSPPLLVHRGGEWRAPTPRERRLCRAARAARPIIAEPVPAPRIPKELRDELRALGYAE